MIFLQGLIAQDKENFIDGRVFENTYIDSLNPLPGFIFIMQTQILVHFPMKMGISRLTEKTTIKN